MMRKPRGIKLRQFTARLQELNNLLPKFLGSEKSKKIPQEQLNEILLHSVTHGWSKEEMMLGFNFENNPFCAELELLEHMEVAE